MTHEAVRVSQHGTAMTRTVKATYASGVFTPVEPVDLEEG